MYSSTIPVPDPGEGGGGGLGSTSPPHLPTSPPPEEAVIVLKMRISLVYDIASIYSNGLGWFGGGLGCFNGPPIGYANS